MDDIKITGEDMGDLLTVYLEGKPNKKEICPMVMLLLDYYTGDNSEDKMTIKEFMANTTRKRFMLQDLIEKWRR